MTVETQTIKVKSKQGLTLPFAFWKKLGIKEGEEFVVQGTVPVITLIPKRLFSLYEQKRQSLTINKLREMGVEDEKIWQKEKSSLKKTRKKLNKEEYPSLYA
ncbi:MAG: AbrB/MazE/SpoVT family DNA-binding domain-containing protein [Candidatus Kuenenbacteria bacterium]